MPLLHAKTFTSVTL